MQCAAGAVWLERVCSDNLNSVFVRRIDVKDGAVADIELPDPENGAGVRYADLPP